MSKLMFRGWLRARTGALRKHKALYAALVLSIVLSGCFGPTIHRFPNDGLVEIHVTVLGERRFTDIKAEAFGPRGAATHWRQSAEEGNTVTLITRAISPGNWQLRVYVYDGVIEIATAQASFSIKEDERKEVPVEVEVAVGDIDVSVDWEWGPPPTEAPHELIFSRIVSHVNDAGMVYPSFQNIQTNSTNVARFNLYRSVRPDRDFAFVATSSWGIGGLTIRDTTIPNAGTYYYRLTSVTRDGEQSEPTEQVYTFTLAEPGKPIQPVGNTGSRRPTFMWTPGPTSLTYEVALYRTAPAATKLNMPFDYSISGSTASATPRFYLEPGEYRWHVVGTKAEAFAAEYFVTDYGSFTITE